jgi:hypothetical protein
MLETVVFGALCVLGLYAAMGEGMVLKWLRDLLERVTNNRILKYIRPALYECPICMASIWGTAVWLITGNTFSLLWVLYVFGIAGFNYVTINLISDDE